MIKNLLLLVFMMMGFLNANAQGNPCSIFIETAEIDSCVGFDTHSTADDLTYYTIVAISNNGGSSGQFQIQGIPGVYTYGSSAQITLASQGLDYNLILTDFDDSNCSLTHQTPVMYSCSPTCDDQIQNGDETGIDCGGATCPICCFAPVEYDATVISGTSCLIDWAASPGADFNQVKYRQKGTSAWLTIGTANQQRVLNNLTPSKYYQYKIRSHCTNGNWTDFTPIQTFYMSTCPIPTGIATINLVDGTRKRIRWDANSSVQKNKIKYRVVGTSTWTLKNSTPGNNWLYLNGLIYGGQYEYRLRAQCNNGEWSEYSDLYFFGNSVGRLSNSNEIEESFSIFPNPAKDVLNVTFETNESSDVTITITDVLGKTILNQTNSYSEGQQTEPLDVSRLNKGYYFISIRNGDHVRTMKFIKS